MPAGHSHGDISPALGYEPRGTRRPRPRPQPEPVSARGSAFPVRGWWLFILLAIFAFRACATRSETRWSPPTYDPPPRIRPAPRLHEAPPVGEEGTRPEDPQESLQSPEH